MDYKIISKDNKRYLSVPKLTKLGLKHVFTTSDMDMGIRTNPSIADLENNIKLINKALDINPKALYGGVQTHSKNVESIIDLNLGKQNKIGRFISDRDGLVTNIKNISLYTSYADCTPIILFDPVKKVHSNIHSGWKGTLKEISKEAVSKMIKDYNCKAEDIIAVLGPSIGKDDFEVEEDVMTQFKDKFEFHKSIIKKKNNVKYLIDILETNKRILLEAGILESNLTLIDLSTKSNPLFHSYRRDGEAFSLMGCISCLV